MPGTSRAAVPVTMAGGGRPEQGFTGSTVTIGSAGEWYLSLGYNYKRHRIVALVIADVEIKLPMQKWQ